MLRSTTIALIMSTIILMSGCKDSSNTQANQSASQQSNSPSSTTSWILTEAPDGAVSVTEAKLNANEGDPIVIRGRIGGRRTPISEGSPVFTIVDLGLEYCGQSTDDNCRTPWDYCCETPDTMMSNTATIQVQGDTIDLTASGLDPLDEIVLVGTVGPRPDEQVLMVKATGIYLVGG